MLKEREPEKLSYRVVEEKENPGECVIQKTGMVAEFTLDDIARDLMLLKKKKEELEGQMKVEEARMVNIDSTNPEVGKMSEEMRQVVFIYTKSHSFAKVAKEKIAEIEKLEKEYREEMMAIAMETGLGVKTENGE